jgi:hypothetical protein
MSLTHLSKLENRVITQEFTPDHLKIYSPDPTGFSFNCCVNAGARMSSDDPNSPLPRDFKSQISLTMETSVRTDRESNKQIVDVKIKELTSALIKPTGKKKRKYIIFQDKLSVSIVTETSELNLTSRMPGDLLKEAQHNFNHERETGFNAALNVDPTGGGGLDVGGNIRNLDAHTVGISVTDFEGYLNGNEGWDFKLKQVDDGSGGRIHYPGDTEENIKEVLLKTRGCFAGIFGKKSKLLTPPQQATSTLRPPECSKKWEVNRDYTGIAKAIVQIEQSINFIDQDSRFDSLICRLIVPIDINFSDFNVTYGQLSFSTKESERVLPILSRRV